MNTSVFINTLRNNPDKKLNFQLPDGDTLSGDLHITEIKHQHIESVDCGANAHSFRETVIQLWVNETSYKEAEWTTGKALSIVDKVGKVKPYAEDSEVFIEFGDSKHPTIKYSVNGFHKTSDELTVGMGVKATACKPRLALGQAAGCC